MSVTERKTLSGVVKRLIDQINISQLHGRKSSQDEAREILLRNESLISAARAWEKLIDKFFEYVEQIVNFPNLFQLDTWIMHVAPVSRILRDA